MASIMQDAFHRCSPEKRPRIVGLTASFVNGELSALEKKRLALQQMMLSNLIKPVVPDDIVTQARCLFRLALGVVALACEGVYVLSYASGALMLCSLR